MMWFWIAYALIGLGVARLTWVGIEGSDEAAHTDDMELWLTGMFLSCIAGAIWPIVVVGRFIAYGFASPFKAKANG